MEGILEQIISHKLSIAALVVFVFTARYSVAYWRIRAKSKAMLAEVDLIESLKEDIQKLTTDYLKELSTVRLLSVKIRDFDMIVQERDALKVKVVELQADNLLMKEVIAECDRCKIRLQERLHKLSAMQDQIDQHQKNKSNE